MSKTFPYTIDLSPDEWRLFGRDKKDDEDSALPSCCGNISDLRDAILDISATGGEVDEQQHTALARHWDFCRDGHEFDDARFPSWRPLRSLIEQAGLPKALRWK